MGKTSANSTIAGARSVHGSDPQLLVEKIIRGRIYESRYWKEHCFGVDAADVVDRACELTAVGGAVGGHVKPTPFLCLVLKLLQLQPETEIVLEFVRNTDFKYLRCLGAFYLRLTFGARQCYEHLEPLLADYRKVKYLAKDGTMRVCHVDEFADDLLTQDRLCDVILPRITARRAMELNEALPPRENLLGSAAEESSSSNYSGSDTDGGDGNKERADKEEEFEIQQGNLRAVGASLPNGNGRRRSRSRSPYDNEKWRHRRRSGSRSRSRSLSPPPPRYRRRSPSPYDEDGRSYRRGREGRRRSPSPDYNWRDHQRGDRSRSPVADHFRGRSPSLSGDWSRRQHGSERVQSPPPSHPRICSASREGGGEEVERSLKLRFKGSNRSGGGDGGSSKSKSKSKTPKEDSYKDVKKKKEEKKKKTPEEEIAEANALRASLGLKPLRS